MKKIFYSMLMLAMAATTFMSCEDVPMPYSWPETETGETPTETVEPKGSGTVDDPYNVAGAQALIQTLGADVNSEEIYCKGYISQINEISTSYGNATFFISDVKGSTAGQLEVYRANSVGGKKFTSEDEIKEGDEVVIRGKVVNFRGNTPEFTQGCYIYSLNGGGGGGDTPKPGEPSGDGTLANPYNAAGANAFVKSLPADQNSDKDIYIKGKIIDITDNNQFNTQYGNCTFYISDDGTDSGEKFYVFRTLYLGNVKYTEGVKPKKGDEVIICGKVVNYKGNTPETVQNQSYIYSLNGNTGGGDTPQPGGATGNGTLANPYNAAGANAYVSSLPADQNSDKDIYIKGKIIDISENNQFNTQYGNCTFYISDDGTDSGEKFYVFRTLYLGNVKYTEGVKPKKGDEVIICGKVVNYKGNTPETVQNQSYIYSLNGNTGGGDTPQPGGATGNGTLANPYNAAGANAYVSSLPADQNSDKDIYIKGKIISISDNNQFSTQYGNCTFYISDDGTNNGEKFYVFRTLYLGNVKYTEGVKPKAGDEVIICGKVVNYKGNTPETVQNQSYIYSLNGNTGSGGGGDTPSGNAGTTAANPFTPQQANAFVSGLPADQNTDKDYYIKGKIISISDNNQFNAKYGNCTFYISADGTDGGEKFYVFRTLYLGNVKYTEGTLPKAGDEVIICGKLVNYKGNTPETVQNQSYIYSLNGSTSAGAKRYAPRRR